MNRHDDTEQRVSTWLHDEAQGEIPDWVLDQTFETTQETPQRRGLRGRLWALAGSRTTHQGRTMMLTMPKLAAVVAVTALATAAAFSVSQTNDDPMPAAIEASPTAPIEFTGTTLIGPCSGNQLNTFNDVARQSRNIDGSPRYCINPSEFEEPMLQGQFRVWAHNDDYNDGPVIWASRFSMHDDDGAWVQRPTYGLAHADGSGPDDTVIMDGSGAYEGLTIIAEVGLANSTWTWHGYILDGDLPPMTEVVLPE